MPSRIRNLKLGPPQAPYAGIEGQCSREGEPTRVAPAAVVPYLQKMYAKAAARSLATLSARLVLQQTYQAAISLHRAAFWHMLERLVTRIRRRNALNRWHQTARARNTERASIVARQMRRAKSQQLRIDSLRLGRRADRPGTFTIRRLNGEEVHIPAQGINKVKDIYTKVREVLDLPWDVSARLVDLDESGLFPINSQGGLPESDEQWIGAQLPGSLLGLFLLSQFHVWVRLPDGEVRDIICHIDPSPIARELGLHPPTAPEPRGIGPMRVSPKTLCSLAWPPV